MATAAPLDLACQARSGDSPGSPDAPDAPDYWRLLAAAREPGTPCTQALAGVIAQGLALGQRPLLRGLSEGGFADLMASCFPGLALTNGKDDGKGDNNGPGMAGVDEYDDLVALLTAHRIDDSSAQLGLAHAIATASLRNNHLWQDLGLPNRQVLSQLMRENFPTLAVLNVGDMKWKKFFYRQLCEQAEVLICKSPNCAVCDDHGLCFGPEEGAALPALREPAHA